MKALIENMLVLPLLVGLIFVITAIVVHRFPPRKINHLYGYRTAASMGSEERWAFAQDFSTVKMFETGIALIALSFTGIAVSWDFAVKFIIGIVPVLLCCAYIYFATEKAIRNKFPDSTT